MEVARLRKELGDEMSYAITLNNIGELYLMKEDYQTAMKYFQQSLLIAEKFEYKDFMLHLYKMLSDTYLKMEDFSRAYDYLSRSMVLNDSVFNEQRNKQIVELQTKTKQKRKSRKSQC